MTDRYDLSRVSRETLEECADILLAMRRMTLCPSDLSKVASAIEKQARIPLRTRAEVDAEIAYVVRENLPLPSTQHGAIWEIRGAFPERLAKLCAEPTAEPEK